ncbi:MAG: ADP-ribosylglycohydrolase family protein [Bacteroidota bacterium]
MSLTLRDRVVGSILGSALGDALGMPIEGLSHINVRTYYKGIKTMRADEKRADLEAGQVTADTQRARALTRALASAPPDSPEAARQAFADELARLTTLRRGDIHASPSAMPAASAVALGVIARLRGLREIALARWAALLFAPIDPHPVAHVAAAAQAAAIRAALEVDPNDMDGAPILARALATARDAERILSADGSVSRRLDELATRLQEYPLDLQDRCNGTGSAADEAFPYAVAMGTRGVHLAEATLLSAINVGGDAAAIGAMTGALVGAVHGAEAFPAEWVEALEDSGGILAEAHTLMDAVDG